MKVKLIFKELKEELNKKFPLTNEYIWIREIFINETIEQETFFNFK